MSMDKKHPLGVLIRNVRTVNGWTQQQVADRAKRAGHKMSKSSVSSAEAGESINSVSIKQVRLWADALGLPERHVLAAFLAAMGYAPEASTETTVEAAIRADTRLSSDDKGLLLTMVKQLRAQSNVTHARFGEPELPDDVAADRQNRPTVQERDPGLRAQRKSGEENQDTGE